ncbi:MAG TPA: SPW repeat protein, partial [Solirubrobacteraceae bacterium]|nr:SPW repeat protein [Solirubrobacteraceae bacterium]
MRRGFVPLDVHAAIEPIAAVLLIAAPWIFQFSDVNSAKIISIVVGVIMLLSGAMTRWRFAIVRVIPLRTHFMTDLLLGVVLIVSPFVFGFSGNGAATRFMIVARILELMTALATRWEPVGARDHKSSSSRMALRAEPKFRHQRLPEAHSVSEMSSGPSRRAIAIAQAAYYVPTAIAPFVSRRGFESITGP